MLISAVLGTFFHPGIFAINLSLFIRENRLLRYVLKSAVDHYDQLIITIVLGLIVLYWYSSVTFYSDWRGDYKFEDRINCETLINCFRSHIDYGFLAFPIWDSDLSPNRAAAYNFSYTMIVNLIITAIISGIIIDTFS